MTTTSSAPFSYPPLPDVLDVLQERGHNPVQEQPHRFKDAYGYLCPFHDDSHPSFWVTGDRQRWNCWTCGGGGVTKLLQMFGQGPAYRPPKAPKSPQKTGAEERLQGCTLAQVAKAKAMPPEHLRDLGWSDTEHTYKIADGTYAICKAVAIPYQNSVQLRVGLDQGQRFKWEYGHEANAKELYGVEWLLPIDRVVLVVEGATDVAAARYMGIPAVGIPGTSTWKSNGKKWAERLAGHELVVWQEPGEAAEKMVDAIPQDIPDLRVIKAPDGVKDVCELLDQAGSGAADWLRELMAEAEPYFDLTTIPSVNPAQGGGNVPNRVLGVFRRYSIRDRSSLWRHAKELFPMGGKPWKRSAVMGSKKTGESLTVDFIGSTWRWGPNAQHKRSCLYFNMLPRINGRQVYAHRRAADDWSDKSHEALEKRIERAIKKSDDPKLGRLWFNNLDKRGYVLYLTNVPDLHGFEPVEDVEATLIDALKAIAPPSSGTPGRFRPYGGSDNWTSKVENTGEEDRDEWEILAVADKETDFVQIEAECIASGAEYEFVKPFWRSQVGNGLKAKMPPWEAVKLASVLGYHLTKHGRAVASPMSADGSQRAEDAPHEWGWSGPPDGDGPVIVEVII